MSIRLKSLIIGRLLLKNKVTKYSKIKRLADPLI